MFWLPASGTGLLLKSLIGVLFPLAAGVIYLLLTHQLFSARTWKRLRPFSGIAIILLIAVPWHVLATLRNPPYFAFDMRSLPGEYHGFLWFFFINEQLLRFLNLRYPRDYDTVPRIYFWLLHLVWLFPWSVYLPAVAKLSYKPSDRAGQVRLLALCWIGFVLVFFTFSTTQEYYSMPCYPAFALLLGSALATGSDWVRRGTRALSVIAGLRGVGRAGHPVPGARSTNAGGHFHCAHLPSLRLQALDGTHAGPNARIVRLPPPSSLRRGPRLFDRRIGNASSSGTEGLPRGRAHDGLVLPGRSPGLGGFRPVFVLPSAGRSAVAFARRQADRGQTLLRIFVGFLLHRTAPRFF